MSLVGSHTRQRLSPGFTSTHWPWVPSVQSAVFVHAPSTAQAPVDKAQRGPAATADAAHSSSDWQPRHTFAVSQIGVATVQPVSSRQSTQVAVAGSHWVVLPHPAPVPDGSQPAHLPLSAPAREHAGVPLALFRHRASAFVALSHATQIPPSHSGAVAAGQSPSLRHSSQEPGDPTQTFAVPVPEQAAPLPQTHPRFEHPFASVVLHAAPHAVHCEALVATQTGAPVLSAQHRLSLEQPVESEGSQAPHAPFCGPVVTQAPAPPGFAAQRSFATDAMEAVSQATQALPTQRGFFGSPLQSASAAHSTQ